MSPPIALQKLRVCCVVSKNFVLVVRVFKFKEYGFYLRQTPANPAVSQVGVVVQNLAVLNSPRGFMTSDDCTLQLRMLRKFGVAAGLA